MTVPDSSARLGLGYWRFTANPTHGRRVSDLSDEELCEVAAVVRAELAERQTKERSGEGSRS